MVYGATLRLPRDVFIWPGNEQFDLTYYVECLRLFVKSLKPPSASRHSNNRSPCDFQDLATASHVFLRDDTVADSLKHPYTGPHEVLQRGDRVFKIVLNGKIILVSIDRLKRVYTHNSPTKTQIKHSQAPYNTHTTNTIIHLHTPKAEENIIKAIRSGCRVRFSDYYRTWDRFRRVV